MEEHVKELIDKRAKRYIEIDSKAYVETGDIVTIGLPIKRDELVQGLIDKTPNTGFHIFRDTIMYRMLNLIGAKGKIAASIMKEKRETNILYTSIKEIADDSGTSVQAVTDCLKLFEEHGLIAVKKDGVRREIFINPGIAHRGNRYREKALMYEFGQFAKEAEKERKDAKKQKEDDA